MGVLSATVTIRNHRAVHGVPQEPFGVMRKSCTTAFLATVWELRVTRPDGYQGLLLKLDLISKTKPALISFMGSFYSQELVYVYRGFPQDTVLYLPRSPGTVSKFYSETAQLQKPPCHRGRQRATVKIPFQKQRK